MGKLIETEADVLALTLRKVIELGFQVAFECRHCRKWGVQDALALIHKYGPEIKLEKLRDDAKCTRCRRRQARVLLKRPYQSRRHAWIPHDPPGRG